MGMTVDIWEEASRVPRRIQRKILQSSKCLGQQAEARLTDIWVITMAVLTNWRGWGCYAPLITNKRQTQSSCRRPVQWQSPNRRIQCCSLLQLYHSSVRLAPHAVPKREGETGIDSTSCKAHELQYFVILVKTTLGNWTQEVSPCLGWPHTSRSGISPLAVSKILPVVHYTG